MSSLKDRLSKVAARSAPNLNPDRVAPPPKKEAEQLPDMREVIPSANDRLKLMRLVEAHVAYGQQEKAAKNAKKPLTTAIKNLLGEYGAGKLMVEGNRVNYFNAPRSSIKKELLLEHGISPKIIEACTVQTDAFTLKITPPGAEDDD